MTSDERGSGLELRLAALAFVVVFCGAAAASLVTMRFARSPVEQPIAFNHRKHVVDNQLDCSTCHQFYETETFSGLPDADTCAVCHQQPQGKSAEEARLVKMLREHKPLVWNSLFRQPPHIFYSHRRHVVKGQIKCERCHGNIAMTTAPPRQVKRLLMSDCIACHERMHVATDCTTCHR